MRNVGRGEDFFKWLRGLGVRNWRGWGWLVVEVCGDVGTIMQSCGGGGGVGSKWCCLGGMRR